MELGILVPVFLIAVLNACTPVIPLRPTPEIASTQVAHTPVPVTETPQVVTAPPPVVTALSITPTATFQNPNMPASPPGACAPFRKQMKLYGCVMKFTVDPNTVAAGGTVTFTWEVTGTKKVGLELYHFQGVAVGPGFRSWANLPISGSLSVQLSDLETGVYPLRLWADDPTTGGFAYSAIGYACFEPFFPVRRFVPGIDFCMGGAPIATRIVQQDFEHGRMVWLESEESVYILFEPDSGVTPAEWTIPGVKDSSQPATLRAVTPPAGKYQPQNEFGKIWERYDLLKSLGWALAPVQRFTSVAQRGSNLKLPLIFRLADDRIVYLIDNQGYSRMLIPYWEYLSL